MNCWAVYIVYHPDMAYLRRSLEAVSVQVDGIILVDNSPDEGVETFGDTPAVIIREGRNAGIAKALNDGFAKALEMGAECVISFDQDSIPPPDMVSRYIDFFSSHPDAGELGCIYSGSPGFESPFRETDHVITSGAAIRSEVFSSAGRFRDDYFIDMVDVEYSWRIRMKGWKVFQLSQVRLEHHLGDGLGGIRLFGKKRLCYVRHHSSRWYHIVRNTLILDREYRGVFPVDSSRYRRRMLRRLFRAILFDPDRRLIVSAASKAVKDAGKFDIIPHGHRL